MPLVHELEGLWHTGCILYSYSFFCCREYEYACAGHLEGRWNFSAQYHEQHGPRSRPQYPPHLRWLLEFPEWLQVQVAEAARGPNSPALDVIEAAKLPEIVATGYRAMYVHGMHLRMRYVELSKTTCNSGVACAV
jgi:hypothetical protein